MIQMKKNLFKFWLNLYDGIWSVPVAFFAFWAVGSFLTNTLDMAAGSYDIAFIQPFFLAVAIVIGSANAAIMGMYSLQRGFFRFIYGRRTADGHVINKSKESWEKLTPWQQFKLSLFVPLVYFSAIVIVYMSLT